MDILLAGVQAAIKALSSGMNGVPNLANLAAQASNLVNQLTNAMNSNNSSAPSTWDALVKKLKELLDAAKKPAENNDWQKSLIDALKKLTDELNKKPPCQHRRCVTRIENPKVMELLVKMGKIVPQEC